MNNLEITDGYGLYRRDITTFLYQQVENDTFKGNITDINMLYTNEKKIVFKDTRRRTKFRLESKETQV